MCATTPPSDPVGIPAAFFYILVRQRDRINPPTDYGLSDCRGTEHFAVRNLLVLLTTLDTTMGSVDVLRHLHDCYKSFDLTKYPFGWEVLNKNVFVSM